MKTLPLFAALFAAVATLSACTTVPPTRVAQPMTVRPPEPSTMPAVNGSIYQASMSRPLFEDRRARYVGDTMTITIAENTSASKKSNNKLDRTATNKASVTSMTRLPGQSTVGLNLNTNTSETFEGKGDAANNNVFSGSITVTVIDVFPNGNLLVSGEKQLAISNEQEFVRLSGVVNPNFVDASNTISSLKVADARIEYKSSGQLNDGMVMGWLGRAFLSVLPF